MFTHVDACRYQDLLDAASPTYQDCRQLLSFNSRWHE